MKALILCAGAATRLRPLTLTRAKAAVPVANRPVLLHIIDYLASFGMESIGIVVAPGDEGLRDLVMRDVSPHLSLTWLEQDRPLGIAHALLAARSFVAGDPFLLYLGDNLTDQDLTPALATFQAAQPAALLLVRPVANPNAFGIAFVQNNQVLDVVEKPELAVGNLAIAGIYLFSPAIWDAAQQVQPSARGEYELTDAIAHLIATYQTVLAHTMAGWWQDMGSPDGLLAANRELLDRIPTWIDPAASLSDCDIQGRVQIGPGCQLENTVLRGPLLLGSNCLLRNAYVGPYTSLGDDVVLEDAAIEHSIVMEGTIIQSLRPRLSDCLLGQRVRLQAHRDGQISLFTGDDTQLHLDQGR